MSCSRAGLWLCSCCQNPCVLTALPSAGIQATRRLVPWEGTQAAGHHAARLLACVPSRHVCPPGACALGPSCFHHSAPDPGSTLKEFGVIPSLPPFALHCVILIEGNKPLELSASGVSSVSHAAARGPVAARGVTLSVTPKVQTLPGYTRCSDVSLGLRRPLPPGTQC